MKVVHLGVFGHLLEALRLGTKKFDVRVRRNYVDEIEVGDTIEFDQSVRKRVAAIYVYSDFNKMLDNHDAKEIYPGAGRDLALVVLRQIYTRTEERRGVLVFKLEDIRHDQK